ncbi:CgeB family protein [Cerasicoccus maritimus]|uniref:CgeB family protein n=1 Tax=Cerasicoccus maritimus TaxID=490089 RepID=UPI0028528A19|nr:glycosyltransferase [Cerasicoccus maritimus]
MQATYIGILTKGTTSRMRADVLKALTPSWEWNWVDTHKPYLQAPRWAKTLSFRLKMGPVISQTNALVQRELKPQQDFIWVDKAANLSVPTTKIMRECGAKLIHYTPDTAYHTNRSKSFDQSLQYYDWAISTKTFEAEDYAKWLPAERLIFTTQAYDPHFHYPRVSLEEKRLEAAFIGLCEPDREQCAEALLNAGVPLRLAGVNWGNFCERHAGNPNLHFVGVEIYGDDYAKLISQASVGLGLVSKRFPELHTTRTFEIPACGTILATESNSETRSFFTDDEALFYNDYTDLAAKVAQLLQRPEQLKAMTRAGEARVKLDKRDYHSILTSLLEQTGALPDRA